LLGSLLGPELKGWVVLSFLELLIFFPQADRRGMKHLLKSIIRFSNIILGQNISNYPWMRSPSNYTLRLS